MSTTISSCVRSGGIISVGTGEGAEADCSADWGNREYDLVSGARQDKLTVELTALSVAEVDRGTNKDRGGGTVNEPSLCVRRPYEGP